MSKFLEDLFNQKISGRFKNKDVDLTKSKVLNMEKFSLKNLEPKSFPSKTGLVYTGSPEHILAMKNNALFGTGFICDRCGRKIPVYYKDTLCKECSDEINNYNIASVWNKDKKTIKRLESDRVWFLQG